METEIRWESVGPFKQYRCVVNGWTVPLLEARELDGGKVSLILNGWRGYTCSVAEAEGLVPFLADVVASALGYRFHPRGDDDEADRSRVVAAVPHEALAPSRIVELTQAEEE